MRFFICGSALSGQPDHKNLLSAELLGPTRTAAKYRLHTVKDGWHPGVYKVESGGISILGELYRLTDDQYHSLMAGEPPDLYEDDIELEDGSTAKAMVYPLELIEKHGWPDISHHGGWAAYKAAES
jgi:gamma-glutamylaminecyclotransferase